MQQVERGGRGRFQGKSSSIAVGRSDRPISLFLYFSPENYRFDGRKYEPNLFKIYIYLLNEINNRERTNQKRTHQKIFTEKKNRKMRNKTREKRTSIHDNFTHENFKK